MFVLLILSILALWMNFLLYPLALKLWRRVGARGPGKACLGESSPCWPRLAVIIPVLNEEMFIERKLRNVLALEYPEDRREILVVDGGSSDHTLEIAQRVAAEFPGRALTVLRAPVAGKALQMNVALRRARDPELVVITDADVDIRPADALLGAAAHFARHPHTAVLGGWTVPAARTYPAERLFLAAENALRVLESRAHSSSLVIGTFCVFRRSLLTYFPDDCVADDAYLSLCANASGARVVLAPEIEAFEYRTPGTMREFFRHKLRKAHAYYGELIRFWPRTGTMAAHGRILYGFKLFQFFVLPWLTLPLPAVLLALVVSGNTAAALGAGLAASVALLGPLLRGGGAVEREPLSAGSLIAVLEYCAVIHLVLLCTPFLYLYRPMDPAFERIGAT